MKQFLIKTLIIYFCLLHYSEGKSQHELGLGAHYFLQDKNDNYMLQLFVKSDIESVKQALSTTNGQIKFHIKDMFSISIAKSEYQGFIDQLNNAEIEYSYKEGKLLMDTAIVVNNVLPIHQGLSPLNQSYTGSGVVVGILDSGIYFEHDDFKNSNGSTRIKYIWDQNVSGGGGPAPYGYGQDWSFIDIDNGSCSHVEPPSQFGHGTTVAGAACGNGSATGYFTGVAPESDIIAVNVDYSQNFLPHVVDAIDYVFKKADAMGKPCVINTSIGTYFGSHDGKDMASQIIDALIEERSGRAVVAAAGNGNNIDTFNMNFTPAHLSYEITADTSFTWFKRLPENVVYFDLWADTADFNEVWFSIGNDSIATQKPFGRTEYFNVKTLPGILSQGIYLPLDLMYQDSLNQGLVELFVQEISGRYHVEVLISPTDIYNIWRFSTTGIGTFDIWSSKVFQGTSDMVITNLPSDSLLPEIVHYKLPDNKKSIVSSWQCSDKVITVANYSNRAKYYDVDSNLQQTGENPGQIYYKSSEGPTRDNRLKPDIAATGNQTMATGNLDFIASALAVNRPKVAFDALHNRNGGTSMASPIVAGALALYLEKNPTANWEEMKLAVTQNALKDIFTGNSANTIYGYGKLDAYNMIQFEAIYGCTDSSAFNFNSSANVDDGSCVPIVLGCTDDMAFNYNPNANTDDMSCIDSIFGCTDSLALNYNPMANVANDSCEYTTGIVNDYSLSKTLSIHPNPTDNQLFIKLNTNTIIENIELDIYNNFGSLVVNESLSSLSNEWNLDLGSLPSGVYFLRVNGTDYLSTFKKVIIY